MRKTEPFGEDDAGLGGALIVGLQAGQDEIDVLVTDGVGQHTGNDKRIDAYGRETLVLDVNRAIGATRQCLAQDLRSARGPRRADHNLAAVRFAKAQRLLERIRVGLVHLEAGVLLAYAPLGVVDPRLPFTGRNLFDANSDAHEGSAPTRAF